MAQRNIDISGKSFGRYQVQDSIGKGGMAEVFKAYDTQLDRYVALKIINPQFGDASAYLVRFEREAKALARLSHPHIVKVLEYGGYKDMPYLVMEYLPGGTLKDRICAVQPYQQAASFLLPIARALDYAHQHHIIHRDVKPANILFSDSGDPLLSDFGIIKLMDVADQSNLTGNGIVIGTTDYMPPEQWTGLASPQTDIYALGVIYYQLITGKLPYISGSAPERVIHQILDTLPDPSQFIADLPSLVDEFIQNTLAKDPDDRYKNAQEVARILEELAATKPAPTPIQTRLTQESPALQSPAEETPEKPEEPEDSSSNRFGRYRLMEAVGDNKGTGCTWRAQDSQLERMVILRLFQHIKDSSPTMLKLFEEETARLSSLVHPNIARLLDYGIELGTPFLVTQFITSVSLQGQTGSPIPWYEVMAFLLPITHALSAAHNLGIYHRDLKPANILISHSGAPILIGFTPPVLTQLDSEPPFVNLYAAPEQLAGEIPDQRSDIYALGAIAYQMLTGTPPYSAKTAPALVYQQLTLPLPDPRPNLPDLPDDAWLFCQKMLYSDPNKRFQDIKTVTAELESLLKKAPARAKVTNGAYSTAEWSSPQVPHQEGKKRRGFRYFLRLFLFTLILLVSSILVMYFYTSGRIAWLEIH